MISLRTYITLDNLQPQLASYTGTTSKGFLPLPGQASLYVEVAPGMAINQAMDVILKATSVTPGLMIVERSYGLLEVHHDDQGEVRQAGDALLSFYELEEKARIKPRVVSDQVIRSIEPYHSQLINKIRYGSMVLSGESLFILETEPAGYAVFAANEAEKASDIKLIEVRSFGAYGRLYMSGTEAMIDSAREAAITALESVAGTSGK